MTSGQGPEVDPVPRCGSHAWVLTPGASGESSADAVEVAADGTIVVAGGFGGTIAFGAGADALELTAPSPPGAGFLVALDPTGEPRWGHVVGRGHERPFRLAITDDGDILVGGAFSGHAVWPDGAGGEVEREGSGMWDAWVARYGPDGALRWLTQGAGAGARDIVESIAARGDAVYLTVTSDSPELALGGRVLSPHRVGDPASDAHVVALDALTAETVWAAVVASGLGSDDHALASVALTDEAVAVGGTSGFGDLIVTDVEDTHPIDMPTEARAWQAVLGATGTHRAAGPAAAPGGYEVWSMASTAAGDLLTAGTFFESVSFDLGDGGELTFWADGIALPSWIARADVDGVVRWARWIDTDGQVRVKGLATEGAAVGAVGAFLGRADFGDDTRRAWFQSEDGREDGFFARYDVDTGGLVCLAFVGSEGDQQVRDVAFDGEGVAVWVGTGRGPLEIDGAPAGELDSEGTAEAFIVRTALDTP